MLTTDKNNSRKLYTTAQKCVSGSEVWGHFDSGFKLSQPKSTRHIAHCTWNC